MRFAQSRRDLAKQRFRFRDKSQLEQSKFTCIQEFSYFTLKRYRASQLIEVASD